MRELCCHCLPPWPSKELGAAPAGARKRARRNGRPEGRPGQRRLWVLGTIHQSRVPRRTRIRMLGPTTKIKQHSESPPPSRAECEPNLFPKRAPSTPPNAGGVSGAPTLPPVSSQPTRKRQLGFPRHPSIRRMWVGPCRDNHDPIFLAHCLRSLPEYVLPSLLTTQDPTSPRGRASQPIHPSSSSLRSQPSPDEAKATRDHGGRELDPKILPSAF